MHIDCVTLHGIKSNLRNCHHYRDNHLTHSDVKEWAILLRKWNKIIILRVLAVTNKFFKIFFKYLYYTNKLLKSQYILRKNYLWSMHS